MTFDFIVKLKTKNKTNNMRKRISKESINQDGANARPVFLYLSSKQPMISIHSEFVPFFSIRAPSWSHRIRFSFFFRNEDTNNDHQSSCSFQNGYHPVTHEGSKTFSNLETGSIQLVPLSQQESSKPLKQIVTYFLVYLI